MTKDVQNNNSKRKIMREVLLFDQVKSVWNDHKYPVAQSET